MHLLTKIAAPHELLRPWKVATLALGIAFLVAVALYLRLPDWDPGISLLMAVLAYLFAPISIRSLRHARKTPGPQRWTSILLSAFLAWLVIDAAYLAYCALADHPTMRWENFIISGTLYAAAGLLWAQDLPLTALLNRIREALLPKSQES